MGKSRSIRSNQTDLFDGDKDGDFMGGKDLKNASRSVLRLRVRARVRVRVRPI
jgi:hypothetical protein